MGVLRRRPPYGGRYAGKWPIRINPDDVRCAWFQDPADDRWHELEWEHAPGLGTAFSGEAARYARRLAARQDRWPDTGQAVAELLARWDKGMVAGRRERRIAVRLAAERAALPVLARPDDPASQVAYLPGVTGHAAGTEPADAVLRPVPCIDADDDDDQEIFDDPDDSDFYADAFDVLQ